jgi:hypothetical protein
VIPFLSFSWRFYSVPFHVISFQLLSLLLRCTLILIPAFPYQIKREMTQLSHLSIHTVIYAA